MRNNILNVNEIIENECKGSGNFGRQNKLHSCTRGVRMLAVGIWCIRCVTGVRVPMSMPANMICESVEIVTLNVCREFLRTYFSFI